MTTTDAPRTQAPRTTPVEAMPPLSVTTQGVPPAELLPPTPTDEETRAQQARRAFAWALSGVLVLVAVVAGVLLWLPRTSGVHMGLSDAAWSELRAGERVVLVVPAVHGSDWTAYRAGERGA
jgi:hypothetical protein